MTGVDGLASSASTGGTVSRFTKGSVTACLVLAAITVVFAVLGIVRSYMAAPFGDMWDGYVGFYLQTGPGAWAPWFAAHNEHRIVLSRLFFYADIAWFGAKGIVPLTLNVVLASGIALGFSWAAARLGGAMPDSTRRAVVAFIVAMTFFWSQQENFTWAFQTQFFFAQCLPLLSFVLAARGAEAHSDAWFAAGATTCGILALGSMANGVLVLPMLLVLGACIGLRRAWLVATGVATACSLLLLRYGLVPDHSQTPLLTVLASRPFDAVHFVLRYLGSPLWFALGERPWSIGIVETAGASIVAAALVGLPGAWRERRVAPMRLAMLAMIGFVIASAAGTALGRLPLAQGLENALVSRYSGLAGMAWIATLVASLPSLERTRVRVYLPYIVFAWLLAMMPVQLSAGQRHGKLLYKRELATLALATQMNDPSAIAFVYPADRAQHALSVAASARRAGFQAFGSPVLFAAPDWLGMTVTDPECGVGIDTVRPLDASGRDRRVDGHLPGAPVSSTTQTALIVNSRDTIVGWALIRGKSAGGRGEPARGVPFSGYVRTPRSGDTDGSPEALRVCRVPTSAPFAFSE